MQIVQLLLMRQFFVEKVSAEEQILGLIDIMTSAE